MNRRTGGLLLIVIVGSLAGALFVAVGGSVAEVGGGFGVGAGQSEEYALSMDSSIDVEPQTVTLEGTSFTFAEIGKTTTESEFTVTATAPSGSDYSIYIYNNDEQIQDTKRLKGSGSATFDAGSLDPGTYLLAIKGPEGEMRSVMPLVVTGYATDLSLPNAATPDEKVTIAVTTTRTDPDAEATTRVSIVITHDGDEREVTAERVADGEYEVTVTFGETGEYGVHAGVHGESMVDGEAQLVGISEKSTIAVDAKTSDDSSDENGGTDDSGGDGTDTDTATETVTPTETATETVTPTGTETATTTATAATDTATTTVTETATTSPPSTGTATGTETGPITPGDDTPAPEPVSMPAKGAQLLLVLLCFVGAVSRATSR